MAEFLPAPSFNFSYNAPAQDIGGAYAKGMTAGTAAGEAAGKGITSLFDTLSRRQNASDLTAAMHQTGMLTDDQYKAIAGKSLGAQESMLGMFASKWMADQANQRALSLEQGKGGIDVATTHAKLLDQLNLQRAGLGPMDPSKRFWQPNQQIQNPQAPQNPIQAQTNYPAPNTGAINAAFQQAGQYGGGQNVGAAIAQAQQIGNQPRGLPQQQPSGAKMMLPGSAYIRRTDPTTGQTQTGWRLPSGQFIAD